MFIPVSHKLLPAHETEEGLLAENIQHTGSTIIPQIEFQLIVPISPQLAVLCIFYPQHLELLVL